MIHPLILYFPSFILDLAILAATAEKKITDAFASLCALIASMPMVIATLITAETYDVLSAIVIFNLNLIIAIASIMTMIKLKSEHNNKY